jgi:uncharacterized cupin superfamily protein
VEVHPGFFVSDTSTDEWEPDPEVPGSDMHVLVHADGVWAGMTRFTSVDGPVTWTPEQREVAMVLEGSVRIDIAGGPSLELGVGDSFSLPAGVQTTWNVTTPFKEMWVLASD